MKSIKMLNLTFSLKIIFRVHLKAHCHWNMKLVRNVELNSY